MGKSLRKARVRWFSDKPKRKGKHRRRSPRQLVALRLRDLAKIFRHRYGVTLPDDDAGRDDVVVAINHLACLASPRGHIARWLDLWAPWLTLAEQKDITVKAMASPEYWKADALAWRLHLTGQERRMLGVTTIGAIDETRDDRTARRRERERQRMEQIRRAQGVRPRAEYLEQSKSRCQPWQSQGISRATWYRRKRENETTETSPRTP